MKTTPILALALLASASAAVAPSASLPTLSGYDREVLVETLHQAAAHDRYLADLSSAYPTAQSAFQGRAQAEDAAADLLATYHVRPIAAAPQRLQR